MRNVRAFIRPLTILAAAGAVAVSGTAAAAAAPARAAGWRVTAVAKLAPGLVAAVVSPAARTAYELASPTSSGGAPYRLSRISLATRKVTAGPAFSVSTLTLAAGYLWVSGATYSPSTKLFKPVLYEVSPATLGVVRRWSAFSPSKVGFSVSVASGPGGTAWIGFGQALLHVRPGPGTVLRRDRLAAAGHFVSGIAANPALTRLYVADQNPGGGAIALELSASTGRVLARSATPLRDSVGGAGLTGLPSGVAASYRTGMLGETVLLRQRGLSQVKVPAKSAGLYGWAMYASTVYGGGALWLNQEITGLTGCVTPGTGAVRASATLKALKDDGALLTVDATARRVYTLAPSSNGSRDTLATIAAPARCWG
jgi:hypothetical protein